MRHCWGTTPACQTEEPTGLDGREGTAGLRDAALQGNTAQARGRSGRHPEHQRDIKQHPHARNPSARARTSLGHDKAARPHRGRAAVAVALGFEPRVAVTPHSISSAAPSAARTRYLTRILYYTDPRATQIDRAGWEQGHTAPRRADPALTNKHAHPWAQLQRARPVLYEHKQ